MATDRRARSEGKDEMSDRAWILDSRWTTDPAVIDGKVCTDCSRAAVAAMARSNGWWCYCGDHLYGRRVENGIVEGLVAVRNVVVADAERGFE